MAPLYAALSSTYPAVSPVSDTDIQTSTRYIPSSDSARVLLTLPNYAVDVGSRFTITGKGLAGWRVAQNSDDQIMGITNSTAGTMGYVQSQSRFDAAEFICIGSRQWKCQAKDGNLTIV